MGKALAAAFEQHDGSLFIPCVTVGGSAAAGLRHSRAPAKAAYQGFRRPAKFVR
jgi:hypothetical protein